MRRRHLTALLLLPSLSSGTLVSGVAGLLVGTNAWAYIRDNSLFYDTLFGPNGLHTYLWQQTAQASAAKNALLASPVAYYVLVTLIAIAVGLAVYTLLQGLSLFASGTLQVWTELETLGPTRKAILHTLLARLTLRVISLIGWALYGACFVSMLLPASLLLNQAGVERITSGDFWGWSSCVAAFVLLVLALHLHVVFARLVFLRHRLFWGDQAILEAEILDHDGHF